MKQNNTILYTTTHHLCTGCGICEDVCPTKSIIIKRIKGENRPVLNKITCLSPKCGRCLKVCPGIGCDLVTLSKALFSSASKTDKYIGRYVSLYTGYSLDEENRFHGASGGMVTTFLIYLLEKKIINGAVVTGFSKKDNITPISYIARNKEDIINARSSKYCPVTMNGVGNEILRSAGKFVIVGLPCHIQGFRKRSEIDKRFKEKVIGYFSIYCSSNRTFGARDFLFQKFNINKNNISYFAFRDNGCLGNLVIKQSVQHKSETPFLHYYGALRSFFKPRRCLTCIDHYGDLADVCFGDIHIPPYSKDKIGISSLIVRNVFFDKLLKQAVYEKYVAINELAPIILNESQKEMLYFKKRKARALMDLDKILLRKSVIYDCVLEKAKIMDYVSVMVINLQRFIGKYQCLWFIINYFFDKRKKI